MPAREEMPATLKRSPEKAQETWAKRLDVRGRSWMTKDELVAAIGRANSRESARSLREGR